MEHSSDRILTTHVGSLPRVSACVDSSDVAWRKLEILARGARLATERLFA